MRKTVLLDEVDDDVRLPAAERRVRILHG
jgi:hypothetical protein